MENLPELISYISFQLDSLGSKNGHHDFEHLCRHLARLVISPNILPATGPVSAGGDQGKDFESFATYTPSALTVESAWGAPPQKALAFTCSLNKNAEKKIREDISTICTAEAKPDVIYSFSSQKIAVAKLGQRTVFGQEADIEDHAPH